MCFGRWKSRETEKHFLCLIGGDNPEKHSYVLTVNEAWLPRNRETLLCLVGGDNPKNIFTKKYVVR